LTTQKIIIPDAVKRGKYLIKHKRGVLTIVLLERIIVRGSELARWRNADNQEESYEDWGQRIVGNRKISGLEQVLIQF